MSRFCFAALLALIGATVACTGDSGSTASDGSSSASGSGSESESSETSGDSQGATGSGVTTGDVGSSTGTTGTTGADAGDGSGTGDPPDGMVLVPGGPFEMGSAEGAPNEMPVHTVDVPTFFIDETEVTVAQFRECVDSGACTRPTGGISPEKSGANYSDEPGDKENHPVNFIAFGDASTYCEWQGKRLPTEAEWEYAAASNDGRRYPWGDEEPDCERATMRGRLGVGCGSGGTMPVGALSLGASSVGAMDMAGNVAEWTQDTYHQDYVGAPADGSGWVADGDGHVCRGGTGFSMAVELRVAWRVRCDDATPLLWLGFRCVLDEA